MLEAAGEIFAERGFRSATVRGICTKAHANVAAVHYHFGDKETLYAAVLKHWAEIALQKYPPHLGLSKDATAEQRLHAFVQTLLFRLMDQGRPAWHGKVMAREMVEPTHALDELFDEVVQPLYRLLAGIVAELIDASPRDARVTDAAFSILGQCVFYCNARPVVERVRPGLKFTPKDIEKLADHITRFSLAALKVL